MEKNTLKEFALMMAEEIKKSKEIAPAGNLKGVLDEAQENSFHSTALLTSQYLSASKKDDRSLSENIYSGPISEKVIPSNIEKTRWNDPLKNTDFITKKEMNDHYGLFLNRIQQQMSTIGGGGEVNLRGLDDVITSSTGTNKFLTYNPATRKFYFDFINVATESELGGIRPGPGFTVSNTGLLELNAGPSFFLDESDVFRLRAATVNVIGGIKSGPGVTINSEGQILLDSAGLEFTFGDFQGIVGTYATGHSDAGEDYALLGSINANEDIVIASNGTGIVKVLGDFSVRSPNGNIDGALLLEPVFRVFNDGKVRFLVPNADPLLGAFEVIGNDTGEIHPPNQTGVIMHTTGNEGLPARKYLDGINNYPIIVGRRYNGAVGALTPVLNNEIFFRLVGQASTGTDFETFGPAKINFIATEDQGPNNQGGKITVDVTANGTDALNYAVTALEITPEGIVSSVGFVGDGNRLTDVRSKVLSVVASTDAFIANTEATTNITNMTLTPPAGTYLASFSSEYVSTLVGSVTATAAADLATLYSQLIALPVGGTSRTASSVYGNGETLGPGVYTQGAAWSINGDLILDAGGVANALFVFRGQGALTTTNTANITFAGGATSNNVWWVSQGAITTGNGATLKGSFLANQAANNPGPNLTLEGRILTVNGAISTNSADITAPTGTINPSLTLGTMNLFSVFAGIGALTNTSTTNIEKSIGTNSGTITGFGSPNVVGGTIFNNIDRLSVITYGIYVDDVEIADSIRSQTQTSLVSGWPMSIQTIATVTAGQTVTVKTSVPIGGFGIGPGMALMLTLVQ
jgi:hypothetical protein